MLQIINPRPIHFSHSEGSDEGKIDMVANYWENARPLIKELEQTVNFAERKYGDLMQQLNLCKEYYEKLSTERYGSHPQKRKTNKRFCRRRRANRNSPGNEPEKVMNQQVGLSFNTKLKNKIYEITNEIKEANRKIVMNQPCVAVNQKQSVEKSHQMNTPRTSGNEAKDEEEKFRGLTERIVRSDTRMAREEEEGVKSGVANPAARPTSKPASATTKKRSAMVVRRSLAGQKYKLRSKSLPQGVRRKFGFGSFIEVVEKQRSKFNEALLNIKSRTTVSSGSRTNVSKSNGDKPRSRDKERKKRVPDKADVKNTDLKCAGDYEVPNRQESGPMTGPTLKNLPNEWGSTGKMSSTTLSVGNDLKSVKTDNYLVGRQRSLVLAPARQPIPFTICRTTKTFNLGLNIQQVLSLIKSKRHSAMLQAILKDNMRTTHSVLHKNDPNINALYIATSSRLARGDSDVCPARDDGDHCYSVISGVNSDDGVKCRMLTCRQSARTQIIENPPIESVTDPPPAATPALRQIKFSEMQRPEDVWVVEQPDSSTSVARFRSRCTCFPSRNSVDYHKVLKQYSRLKHFDQKADAFPGNSLCSTNFPPRFIMSGPDLRSIPSQTRFGFNDKLVGTKIELKKIQEDLDNLYRRFERIRELLEEHNADNFEVDAELDALESELNRREEDCKYILDFYNQLIALKKRVGELRGRIRSTTNITEVNARPSRSRKDPFRPTPSMTLTRVLRQIQCLQDKIKLIDDSPLVT